MALFFGKHFIVSHNVTFDEISSGLLLLFDSSHQNQTEVKLTKHVLAASVGPGRMPNVPIIESDLLALLPNAVLHWKNHQLECNSRRNSHDSSRNGRLWKNNPTNVNAMIGKLFQRIVNNKLNKLPIDNLWWKRDEPKETEWGMARKKKLIKPQSIGANALRFS